MKGILLIAHGSKTKESNIIFENVVNLIKKQYVNDFVIGATIKFSDISIDDSLLKFINLDIKEIIIVPYFLFDGVHVTVDIPNIVNNFLKNYPEVKVSFTSSIGKSPIITDIVVNLINEEKR